MNASSVAERPVRQAGRRANHRLVFPLFPADARNRDFKRGCALTRTLKMIRFRQDAEALEQKAHGRIKPPFGHPFRTGHLFLARCHRLNKPPRSRANGAAVCCAARQFTSVHLCM